MITRKIFKPIFYISNIFIFYFLNFLFSQNFLPADPNYIFLNEKYQYDNKIPFISNSFRPIFFTTDSLSINFNFLSEGYLNNNSPNQENMDLRYFSKGYGIFNSFSLALNSPLFSLMIEPYIYNEKFYDTKDINRQGTFKVLNDRKLDRNFFFKRNNKNIRNFLAFFHYKGFGFGWHDGNRWWGPGFHSTLQMTNNTTPMPSQIIGTINEIKLKNIGLYGLYTFSRLNEETGVNAIYYTALNGQVTWYGPIYISFGFSRNYITGGMSINNYAWTASDARKIIFEGLLTNNLLKKEYTVGGHDYWDQSISTYITFNMPKRNLKLYMELGFNDNRMYLADLISQPDHSMATIIGIRDYGIGSAKKWIWGFEWTNLMTTYSSRHRPSGSGTWYNKYNYDFNTYYGRRWGAHSGSDSDDWTIYLGYLSNKLIILPKINYERHGIVTHRPAEVKFELSLQAKYNYNDTWYGIYLEKQYEAFLGFPDYFYVDNNNNPVDSTDGKLAGTRLITTLIFSISKSINIK